MKRIADLPRHIIWSTDALDLEDPFQRRWYFRQVLLHGLADDIRKLDLDEVAQLLPELDLPSDIRRLWRNYLKERARG
jgi:hypothetical protein